MATEHVLQKYNIADPTIASLTSKPAKLVCQLYENYGAREPGTVHQPPGTGTSKDNENGKAFCRLKVAPYLFRAHLSMTNFAL